MAFDNDATKYDSKSMLLLCMSMIFGKGCSVFNAASHFISTVSNIQRKHKNCNFNQTETRITYMLNARTHHLVESKSETSALKIYFIVVCLCHLPYPEIHLRSL